MKARLSAFTHLLRLFAVLLCSLLPGLSAAATFDCRSVDPKNSMKTLDDGRPVEGASAVEAMCMRAASEGIVHQGLCQTDRTEMKKASARFRCLASTTQATSSQRMLTPSGTVVVPGGNPLARTPQGGNPMLPTTDELADCRAATESCRAGCQAHRSNPDALRYISCMQPCEVSRSTCQNNRMRERLNLN